MGGVFGADDGIADWTADDGAAEGGLELRGVKGGDDGIADEAAGAEVGAAEEGTAVLALALARTDEHSASAAFSTSISYKYNVSKSSSNIFQDIRSI